jgi:hypothetical protein
MWQGRHSGERTLLELHDKGFEQQAHEIGNRQGRSAAHPQGNEIMIDTAQIAILIAGAALIAAVMIIAWLHAWGRV